MELDTFSITELFFEPKKLLGSSIALGSGVEVEGFDTITEVFLVRFNNSFLRVSTLLSNTVLRAWLPTAEVSSLVRCNTDIVSSRWRMVLSVSVSASRVGLLVPFLSRVMQNVGSSTRIHRPGGSRDNFQLYLILQLSSGRLNSSVCQCSNSSSKSAQY